MEIVPLPKAPKERSRIGEELQPIGTYAGIIPYFGTIEDVEVLQEHEQADPEFESKDWWWDHQRIRFLNGKLGLKTLILILRSEEHTSELQSRPHLVCRLLLEKKKKKHKK